MLINKITDKFISVYKLLFYKLQRNHKIIKFKKKITIFYTLGKITQKIKGDEKPHLNNN